MYLQGSLAWLREYDLASGEDEVNEINYVPLGSARIDEGGLGKTCSLLYP